MKYGWSRSWLAVLRQVLLGAFLQVWCAGCHGETTAFDGTESPHARLLRQRFPEHADRVLGLLEQEGGFAATEEGFALRGPPDGAWGGVGVDLPRDGSGWIRMRGFGGGEVRVREVDALGVGAIAERAVAYKRAGGTSFWAVGGGGVEEWLLLDSGMASEKETVLAWDVEGATPKQRGAVVDLVDVMGVVRLSVMAPNAYSGSGKEIRARLQAKGDRIELVAEMGAEALLVDPAWTAAAPMGFPRDGHAATLLPGGEILVTGGYDGISNLHSAERYNSVNNSWSSIAAMNASRYGHTATLLDNGKILVAGGVDSTTVFWLLQSCMTRRTMSGRLLDR